MSSENKPIIGNINKHFSFKSPKIEASNLTAKQKRIFLITLALVVILLATAIFYFVKYREATSSKLNNLPQAANIQAMSCDEAKTTLSSVNSDPDLKQTYTNVTIESVKGNEVSFKSDETTYHYLNLTDASNIQKISGNTVTAGDKSDLKSGVTLTMITANPMNEIIYAGYRN
jgi:hypothetical protein